MATLSEIALQRLCWSGLGWPLCLHLPTSHYPENFFFHHKNNSCRSDELFGKIKFRVSNIITGSQLKKTGFLNC
jgi:hypothetical protein